MSRIGLVNLRIINSVLLIVIFLFKIMIFLLNLRGNRDLEIIFVYIKVRMRELKSIKVIRKDRLVLKVKMNVESHLYTKKENGGNLAMFIIIITNNRFDFFAKKLRFKFEAFVKFKIEQDTSITKE